MLPPINCPYKYLTAPPCWNCANYITDTDECRLNYLAQTAGNNTGGYVNTLNASKARSNEERERDYQKRRMELMALSKEALVDLILRPDTTTDILGVE